MFLFELLNNLIDTYQAVIDTHVLTSKQVMKLINEKDIPRARIFIK